MIGSDNEEPFTREFIGVAAETVGKLGSQGRQVIPASGPWEEKMAGLEFDQR